MIMASANKLVKRNGWFHGHGPMIAITAWGQSEKSVHLFVMSALS